VIFVLQKLAGRIAGAGRRSSGTTYAERDLARADDAWRLLADPKTWGLWMPGIAEVESSPRAPARGVRYGVRFGAGQARLGFGDASTGHVQLEVLGPDEVSWSVFAGDRVLHYAVRRAGSTISCASTGGASAEMLLAQLERETAY
jgi:hypothetical protein